MAMNPAHKSRYAWGATPLLFPLLIGLVLRFCVRKGNQLVNAGNLTIAPPLSADSCAHRPTQVQLADCFAFGKGSRSSASAITNSCAKCGCDAPLPAPWVNLRCVFFARS